MSAAIKEAKKALRLEAQRMRAGAHTKDGLRSAEKAAAAGLAFMRSLPASSVIALYHPIRNEIDSRLLAADLTRAGFATALPVVAGPEKPLLFRRWAVGDDLLEGAFGVLEPVGDAPLVIPDVIICPLLAFDERGYRLGYGGGYYDRTIAEHPEIRAFGLAYAAQLVDNLPICDKDKPMHAVITDEGIIIPGGIETLNVRG